jgi:hypothetical protein
MNRLLCSELITFIEKIGAQNWQQSLNPSHASPYVKLKINRGSVQITPSQIMAETPVIKTDENPEWWSPLDNIWVPRDFDRIDYRIMLSSVLREHSNDISSDLLNAVKKEIRLESPDE